MTKQTEHIIERPPVVVVMGHVDHGKSTLLDFIRKSNTVAKEAGGITQHVAAYEVVRDLSTKLGTGKNVPAKRITFIDTPGHAAFSAIRARGANVADIAILVVAADDGVKAQTLEALASIKDAGIPFIVAINKIDKPNANIERTQASLMEKGVFLEKFGGDVPWAAISAKSGANVEELLDLILLVAEMQEFKGDPGERAKGYIIEAHRDQKRGLAATLIILNGSLKSGMAVTAGSGVAPVRIMEDHNGKTLKEATFSTPVHLVGFDVLPEVGSEFQSYRNKKEAEVARDAYRAQMPRAENAVSSGESSERYMLPVIVRADTTGSLEAIAHETVKIGDEHMGISIVQSGIGSLSEGDIKSALASTDTPAVIGFNVGIDTIAETLGRQHSIEIQMFDIIYKLTEYLEERMRTAAPKRTIEQTLGRAKIQKTFSSHKDEHVVGGTVLEGEIAKGKEVHVLRRNIVVGVGHVKNIQANKQNVDRVEKESEFGAQIEALFEIAPGDIIECFIETTT